ncbi:hypothetical protein CHARACLAT_024398 [Characodon lateralis]|uniref:Uncharacterized protein n=1 Tax=Characodon lateralis TaxID=208331 RepID=A0ABU7CTY3_9TELE|nr:hypothetical protein [Characodon lateralis]
MHPSVWACAPQAPAASGPETGHSLDKSSKMVLEFSGVLGDRCDKSAYCLEVYLSRRLPALQRQSVCLQWLFT